MGNIFRLIVLVAVLYLVFTNMTEIQQFFDLQWTRVIKFLHGVFST